MSKLEGMKNVTMPPAHPTSRRNFLRYGSLTAVAAGVGRGLPAFALLQDAPAPVVKTALGNVRGEMEESIRVFRGIPFAEPPVGALRFRPPVAKKSPHAELNATKFGAAPMQESIPGRMSEDCLQLNLWSPQKAEGLPVFVWIHGGGFTGGRAFDPLFDGSAFAQEGIVCVTVSYRLGVFGFLDMETLLGAEFRGTANNAVQDLMMALDWVQKNIAAFGGDPKRVTVGGESAGAKLTDILLGIPAAQSLFQGAISESGGAERVWPKQNSDAVARAFGKTWTELTGGNAASIREGDPAKLIEAQRRFLEDWPQHFPLRCEVDGELLKRRPVENIAAGCSRGKRLLIGTNRDESASFLGPHPTRDAIAADLGNMPVDQFSKVYARYSEISPDLSIEQRRIRAVTAEEYWIPSVRVAEAHAANGGETYFYRLDFTETSGRLKGYAYHTLELGAVWGKPHRNAANFVEEATLSKRLHTAWSAFIRGGKPSAPGIPSWPQWSTEQRSTMVFDTENRVENLPQAAEMELWRGKL